MTFNLAECSIRVTVLLEHPLGTCSWVSLHNSLVKNKEYEEKQSDLNESSGSHISEMAGVIY